LGGSSGSGVALITHAF